MANGVAKLLVHAGAATSLACGLEKENTTSGWVLGPMSSNVNNTKP